MEEPKPLKKIPTNKDGTAKISELTLTVSENYFLYQELVVKVKAFQDWYKTQKKNYEK